ncbi:MAG: hypothetical protein WCJ36_00795 [Candidatus Saccharibacteria bacterium]
MNNLKKYTIIFTISIGIALLLLLLSTMFIQSKNTMSGVDYSNCYDCSTDYVMGWPLPVYTRSIGGIAGTMDTPINWGNTAVNFSAFLVASFLSISLIKKHKK